MADLNAELTAIAPMVAQELLGEPNRAASSKSELRWGSGGGLALDLAKGTFYDFTEEKGGGVLDLIERETGRKGPDRLKWLAEHGYSIELENGAARPNGAKHAPVEKRIAKVYPYLDADGRVLFEVVRREWPDPEGGPKPKKDFQQRRPTGDGQYEYSVGPELNCVPYRLPEILAAKRQGATIFVVEGEKAADALWELGAPATCNAGGAGKWPTALSAFFEDAHVVILPDADPQKRNSRGEPLWHDDGAPKFDGQDHAKRIARELAPVAASCAVLELPGLPAKGDAYDWTAAAGSLEQLYILAEGATPGPDYDPAAGWRAERPAPAPAYKLPVVLWRDMGRAPEAHEWLVKFWISKGEVSICAGPSGAGKSFFVLDMAMAIARGELFMGRFRTERLAVVYQAGEGPKGLRAKRIPAYRFANDLTYEDDVPLAVIPAQINLWANDDHTDALIADVHRASLDLGVAVGLVVIDTASAATAGADENSSKDVGPVLSRCNRIARETGAHVLLVAHMNADGTKVRGHTSWVANIETVITVTVRPDAHDSTGRAIREAQITKQKDGETLRTRFVLRRIKLSVDEDGDDVTSCVIMLPSDDGATMAEAATGAGQRPRLSDQAIGLLRVIDACLAEHGQLAPSELRLPATCMVVNWEHVRAAYAAGSFVESETPEKFAAAVRQALKRNGEALNAKGLICRRTPWVWRASEAPVTPVTEPSRLHVTPASRPVTEPQEAPEPATEGQPW